MWSQAIKSLDIKRRIWNQILNTDSNKQPTQVSEENYEWVASVTHWLIKR